jgi:hypothetical protein
MNLSNVPEYNSPAQPGMTTERDHQSALAELRLGQGGLTTWSFQVTLGWMDSHLHRFEIDGQRFSPKSEFEDMGDDEIDERKAKLFSVLARVGAKAEYTFDFGDSWKHIILLEKVLAPEPGRSHLPRRNIAVALAATTTFWKRSSIRTTRTMPKRWSGWALMTRRRS